jgi:(p)ppGpp synthase/HD superfamily hydrolase
VVALLHDTVEDKKLTLAEVEKRFGKIVAVAVDALSRRKDEGETYTDFILRAKQNPIARRVKIADIKDNLLTTTDELRGRYEKALKELTT